MKGELASMRSLIAVFLSATLVFSLAGCSGDKKAEQSASKPAVTQEAPKVEKTGFIVGTDVNAREKASTESAIVGTFDLGER